MPELWLNVAIRAKIATASFTSAFFHVVIAISRQSYEKKVSLGAIDSSIIEAVLVSKRRVRR
jgi:hypothetical protein